MWVYNEDINKWEIKEGNISKSSFDVYKQELSSTQFYAKCLSGATYLPANDLNDIYDTIKYKEKKNWFIPISSSPYSETLIPTDDATPIEKVNSDLYYDKNLNDYNLTLKNKFTPSKLINDSINNYYYVDITTTEQINVNASFLNSKIDGVRLLKGHKILVKDQITKESLPITTDPDEYFVGNYTKVSEIGLTAEYEYYNSENGVYVFDGEFLIKEDIFDEYKNAFRYSIVTKLGSNVGKQFHLSRLLDGYYPNESEPKEFLEKKNWMIRNRVDYNNLLEINYYDSIKHGTQSIQFMGITYSIPERTISVGEFGVILDTQNEFGGISNVIRNKYKVNLFSIDETELYYWICGEKGTLLKVRKHDFKIDKVELPEVLGSLNCVDFLSNTIGVVVGDFNTILITSNGGKNWERINISKFRDFDYNKALYHSPTRFFVVGENGVFIEFDKTISGYKAYKRRLSKFTEKLEDEYLLVDDINDIISATVSWNLNFNGTASNINDEFLFVTTNDNNIILYDINKNFDDFKFLYLDFKEDYGDITNITKRKNTDEFYFSSDSGLFSFDFNNFPTMDTTTGIYNIAYGLTGASPVDGGYYNDIFDYNGNQLILSGNESLLLSHTYSLTFDDVIDSGFSDRNKSKMLFMNYDIASKLNFFRDNGEYRLPEPITFTASNYIEFNQPVISGTAQSNWIDYWQDSLQTFEYNTVLGLDESTKVLFSTKFDNVGVYSYSPTINSSNITTELSDILPLAPEIQETSTNKFYGTASISAPSVSKDLYLYKYLMILRLPISLSGKVDVSDVYKLTSDNIETNLVVNKIFTSGFHIYLYMYTGFNDNIIRSIKDNGCTLTNLNKYNSSIPNDLEDKFKYHPLSIAYNLTGTQSYSLSTKFNHKTAYYNLATKIDTESNSYDMLYTDAFIEFGYSPIYNIYDYLRNIDSVKFYSDKEYLSMPIYRGIPLGSLTQSVAYIDTGISSNNKILFGTDLKFEWESVFIDTFVDVNIYGSATYSTEKMLVMDKYYDEKNDAYVIEFHKKLEFNGLDADILNGNGSLDIVSRRKLSQISDDLRILNNIHRSKKSKKITIGSEYFVYDNELTFKIKTNSYTNILLSDQITKDSLSAIIYTDDTNELSMNILNLDDEINPEINTVTEYNGKVSIVFKDKHNLNNGDLILISYSGDSVTTATNGCYPNTSAYNPNFFGSHVAKVLTDNIILLDIDWDPQYILNQFVVSFIKTDSFFNYSPVDLIDVGVDKKGRISIELLPENTLFNNDKYSLINVDFNKYRYRLFDGLTLNDLVVKYPWLLEAEVSNAAIGLVDGELTWYSGIWECGRWFEGNWISGTWLSGDFYGGKWTSKSVIDKKIQIEIADKKIIDDKSIWHTGRWFGGTWEGGIWRTGRWYEGSFNSGEWLDGIWNDGTFNGGKWKGGIWVLGNWNNGNFNCSNKPSYWLDGKFNGGDFGNGVWYNGTFESKKTTARFGTESFNSRPSIWHGGNFLSGSFHSHLDLDDNGNTVRSKTHKYSIWNTGNFINGDFYGGVAYNINFNGTWHGGILEDIQVIGIENVTNGKKLKLNGIFKFNIGNEITIMDSNLNTFKTKVYYVDPVDKYTDIWTTPDVSIPLYTPVVNTGYKVVSVFNNTNWKSGIFTNGVFNSGLWEGGIFYNGIFNGISV